MAPRKLLVGTHPSSRRRRAQADTKKHLRLPPLLRNQRLPVFLRKLRASSTYRRRRAGKEPARSPSPPAPHNPYFHPSVEGHRLRFRNAEQEA